MTTQGDVNATALVLAFHGTRDPEALAATEAFVAAYRDLRDEGEVLIHGYVELAKPHLSDAFAAAAVRARRVQVIPVSLFAAGHVKSELPLLLTAAKARHPGVSWHLSSPLGLDPRLIAAAVAELESAWRTSEGSGESIDDDTALLVIGRGSSDADANSEFFKAARLVGESLKIQQVVPCFIGITGPRLDAALLDLARARPKRILILPYFLFTGVLLKRVEEQVSAFASKHPWLRVVMAPRLLASAALGAVLDAKVRDAQAGEPPLPCTTCQYRVPLGRLSEQVGGLKALLWSVRHTFTHAQTANHAHAHKPITKHVLVCTNSECASRGSLRLVEALRRLLRDRGRSRGSGAIKVTKTSCLGRCGEGPTVVVYPDGVWYRELAPDDAADLVDEHLLNDRLVARRVDSIM